ncbi:MAG: glycosyltransferase family 9 protein [Bacteroidales bacterium]|jgi:ADP-heptose:LPS heptosyltransferase|nr:glycosyltransferase family 9 protein [Bacteroidales bacterium]
MLKLGNSIKNNPIILICRTDGLGDVVLTLPLVGMIKKLLPESRIIFLGKDYTFPVIQCDCDIDQFISWDNLKILSYKSQINFLREKNIDIVLHVFPVKEIVRLTYKARIPLRISTSHRIYNLLYCNKFQSFSRRKSNLHEAQLNILLLKSLFSDLIIPELTDIVQYINFKPVTFAPLGDITKDKFNIILHPKSKGNGKEWGEENFNRLISILQLDKFRIFVCGTQQEGDNIKDTILQPNMDKIIDLTGKLTLSQYISLISQVDCLIASGTGPLHISGVLGKLTIGLFPPIRPMHPERWQPVGKNVKILCKKDKCNKCRKKVSCKCIQDIQPEEISLILKQQLISNNKV